MILKSQQMMEPIFSQILVLSMIKKIKYHSPSKKSRKLRMKLPLSIEKKASSKTMMMKLKLKNSNFIKTLKLSFNQLRFNPGKCYVLRCHRYRQMTMEKLVRRNLFVSTRRKKKKFQRNKVYWYVEFILLNLLIVIYVN